MHSYGTRILVRTQRTAAKKMNRRTALCQTVTPRCHHESEPESCTDRLADRWCINFDRSAAVELHHRFLLDCRWTHRTVWWWRTTPALMENLCFALKCRRCYRRSRKE